MAKEKKDIEKSDDAITAVAIIEPKFERPAFLDTLKLLNKEESLRIIEEKRKVTDALVITDLKDKTGYNAIVKEMGAFKNDRIAYLAAANQNIIDPVKEAIKQYVADIAEIVDAFSAGEKALRDKKDAHDKAVKDAKAKEEEDKVRAMLARSTDLTVLGAMFDGAVYSFPYSEVLLISAADLKNWTDEKFGEFLEDVKTAWGVEQTRLEEAKAEAIRVEQEQAAEAERVQQANIENEKQAAVLKEKRTKLRIKELTMMGFVIDQTAEYPYVYYHPKCGACDLAVLETETDDEWDATIAEMEELIAVGPEVEDNSVKPPVSLPVESQTPIEWTNEVPHTRAEFGATVDPQLENAIDTPKPIAYDLVLSFNSETGPCLDFDISAKHKIRVFPEVYRDEAIGHIEVVGSAGTVQGLNWVLLSR